MTQFINELNEKETSTTTPNINITLGCNIG